MTFTTSSCNQYSANCGKGGFWNPAPDAFEYEDNTIQWPASWSDPASGYKVEGAKRLISGMRIQEFVAYNTTLASASEGSVTYQNGNVGGVPLGFLALGADKPYQEFTLGAQTGQQINGYTFAGKMYEQKNISSYSYGLHIGSAAFGYPGSLVFGGYDTGRIIDPVYSFADVDTVQLLDITTGVAVGPPPSNFSSQTKLLTSSLSVKLDPLSPYLSLPRATCDRLASVLPVTFDNNLKYYLWNTSDPAYTSIVTSPAYLGFSFPENNLTIKAPFALLNLTLEAPITDTPKQYFPCVPNESNFTLGRAFLQAAFVGRNWNTKSSWLAQAPGPGLAKRGLAESQIAEIQDGWTSITGYPNPNNKDQFVDSWSSHWSIAQSPGDGESKHQPSGDAASSGLSTGAKVGIGLGAGVGAIAVLAALIIWRRRSARNKTTDETHDGNPYHVSHDQNEKIALDEYAHQGNSGWNSSGPTAELSNTQNYSPVELGDTNTRNNQL